MEIKDQHVLITGANRGIGRAVALMFAENKAHLHLVNRTSDADLVEELKKLGAPSVKQYRADLSTRKGVEDFLALIGKQEIDILFNNAGQLTGGLLEEQKIEEIYSLLQVNVNALIHLTWAFLPGMLERKKGKIINHSSVSAVMHFPAGSVYSASKAAVLAFTNCLQAELQGTGVSTLTLITPGVDTRMFNEIPQKYGKNLDVSFLRSMPPKKYAGMIREAILEDLAQLKPSGASAVGLALAQHLPSTFQSLVRSRFQRSKSKEK